MYHIFNICYLIYIFSKNPKNQKPINLHFEKTKKPIKKPKKLTMPTIIVR